MRAFRFSVAMSASMMAGCSGSSPLGGGDDDDGASPTPVPANIWHFVTDDVVAGGFSVPAQSEGYQCFIVKVPTGGTGIGATRFAYTPGSNVLHHIIVFSAPDAEVAGTRVCELFEDGWNIRYAGGTVTDPLDMPAGVAMPVKATETFVIQMHYLNAGDVAVLDHTSVDVTFTKPGDSFTAASLMVSGSDSFSIPPSSTGYDVNGTCPLPAQVPEVTVFAIWPHMHQFGTHFNIELVQSGVTSTLVDTPWAFGEQPIWKPAATLRVRGGDAINTTCTYSNPGTEPVTVGESSTQEMCFDFFFYYPALFNQMLPCF